MSPSPPNFTNMGKKKTYTLETQEQELGAIIDQSINAPSSAGEELANSTIRENPMSAIDISTSRQDDITQSGQEERTSSESGTPKEEKKIMKNIWVPAMIDNKLKIIRAYKKQNKSPNTFDAIANEALVEYLERHFEEAMNWG